MASLYNMSLLYSSLVVSKVMYVNTRRGRTDPFCALAIPYRPYHFSVHQPVLNGNVYISVSELSPKLQKVTQPVHAESWKCWRSDTSWEQPSTKDWGLLDTPASPSLRRDKSERSFKDCEESEIFPCLQASRSACHRFVDAGRRHESPGSEKKSFITHSQQAAWASRAHWFPLTPKSRGGDAE